MGRGKGNPQLPDGKKDSAVNRSAARKIPNHEDVKAGKYGQPKEADPNFGPAPGSERHCTDIIFLLLFIGFVIGMVIVAIKGFQLGNPERLVYGTDSYGRICNLKNDQSYLKYPKDLTGSQYLFFGDPSDTKKLQICVPACPVAFPDFTTTQLLGFAPLSDEILANVYCPEEFINATNNGKPSIDDININPLSMTRPCYVGYATRSIVRRCVPLPGGNYTANAVMRAVNDKSDEARIILTDIMEARFKILGCCALAFAFGFVWLLILRFCTGCMVYTSIILMVAASIFVSVFLAYQANQAKIEYDNANAVGEATTSQQYNYYFMYGLAAAVIIFTIIMICVLIYMRERIRLAVVIMEESSKAVEAMPFLTLTPIMNFILLGGFLAYWIAAWLYLGTAGTPTFVNDRFDSYQDDRVVRGLQVYHVFGLFWISQFLIGLNEMTVAGSVAKWYFARDKKNLGWFPIAGSFFRTLRYHLGTIAFASLLIAFVEFARLVLAYIDHQLKGKKNCLVDCLLKCLACCLCLLERFLKFISRNAYIQTAIYGEPFCESSKNAYQILVRNAYRLVAIHVIGDVMLFIGKVAVTMGATAIAIFIMKDDPNLQLYVFPVIIVMILSFIIASLFMSVYQMAINTIFLAFCEDCERNSVSESYWMSPELRHFCNAHAFKVPDLAQA